MIAPGTCIGPYEVTAAIGAGGMGEVLASDAERLARFQREAEVLASLNHPNIAILHGLEKSDGVIALVMELVEGPTLADRLVDGAIPVDEALAIARQITQAFEAAHEQGIIHRDLKPANVKVRPDGTLKVLDFGLAKAMERSDNGAQISAARCRCGSHPVIPTLERPMQTRSAPARRADAVSPGTEVSRG